MLNKLSSKKTVFSIDNNRTIINNSLPITTEQQISIFLFLKDHVTLKPRGMAAENSASYHRNQLYFLYIWSNTKILILGCNNGFKYFCFSVF